MSLSMARAGDSVVVEVGAAEVVDVGGGVVAVPSVVPFDSLADATSAMPQGRVQVISVFHRMVSGYKYRGGEPKPAAFPGEFTFAANRSPPLTQREESKRIPRQTTKISASSHFFRPTTTSNWTWGGPGILPKKWEGSD